VSIWEDLRPREAGKDVKEKLINNVVDVARSKFKELSMKSKSSRVVQAVLKHGTAAHRKLVLDECREHIVEMSLSSYGNHVVRKLISIASRDDLNGVSCTCTQTALPSLSSTAALYDKIRGVYYIGFALTDPSNPWLQLLARYY
jgi:5-methylthioribose kinase